MSVICGITNSRFRKPMLVQYPATANVMWKLLGAQRSFVCSSLTCVIKYIR